MLGMTASALAIQRRRCLLALTLAGGFAAGSQIACRPASETGERGSARPNVLFISVDDLRPELGVYGAEHAITPNIDALARRGVTFDRAYVSVSVCNPSRVALLTGMRPDTTRVWDLHTHFRSTVPDAITLPQHFAAHGYHSLGIGRVHHHPDPKSWSQPFLRLSESAIWSRESRDAVEEWKAQARKDGRGPKAWVDRHRPTLFEDEDVSDSKRPDGALTDMAIATLPELAARVQAGTPFFFAVGYSNPHPPFNAPKRYWDLYDPALLPLTRTPDPPRGAPRAALNLNSELRDYHRTEEIPAPWEGRLSEAKARRMVHGYLSCVSYVDAQIGRLLAALEDEGLADDTIVVLWSDHGWKLGEHGGWGKMTNYEIDNRVPLIVVDPRAETRGSRTAALVESVDVFPTLSELAGLEVPDQVEGVSFAPLLRQPDLEWKSAAFHQFLRKWVGRTGMGRAIRTERWRYVRWTDHEAGELLAEELYDQLNDPDETVNLAQRPTHRAVLEGLRRQLADGWRASLPVSVGDTSASAVHETL